MSPERQREAKRLRRAVRLVRETTRERIVRIGARQALIRVGEERLEKAVAAARVLQSAAVRVAYQRSTPRDYDAYAPWPCDCDNQPAHGAHWRVAHA